MLFRRFMNVTQVCSRFCSTKSFSNYEQPIPGPEYDLDYLCNIDNVNEIQENISKRKGVGNIGKVHRLYKSIENTEIKANLGNLRKELDEELKKIPNRSYPCLIEYGEVPKILKEVGSQKKFLFKPKKFPTIAKSLFRNKNISNFTGHRSYYLIQELAELEHALIKYAVTKLLDKKFLLISVPDILHSSVIESCGMATEGRRTQVYKLDCKHYGPDLCLSGTSEMALAGYIANKNFNISELPLRFVAVSRCFRAETSRTSVEKDLFRVHQFTKVEMFGVSARENSQSLMEEFLGIQEEIFMSLGLHFRVLDMPLHELGPSAYRKYDVEAWLPGRNMYGEISSCSNCTDYQSRRLNIKYTPSEHSTPVHVHTVNGTACAVPRTLIALFETHQEADGSVSLPEVLHCYMRGKGKISPQSKESNFIYMKAKNWSLDRERLNSSTS